MEAHDKSRDITLTERLPVGPAFMTGSEVSLESAEATLAMSCGSPSVQNVLQEAADVRREVRAADICVEIASARRDLRAASMDTEVEGTIR